MDLERARQIMAEWVVEQFGRAVQLREVAVARRATGRVWMGALCCPTRLGELEIGSVDVGEDGTVAGGPTVDDLIDVLAGVVAGGSEVQAEGTETGSAEDDFSDLSLDDDGVGMGDLFGEEDELDGFFAGLEGTDIQERARELIDSGERDQMLEARRLLPQLLTDAERRGTVLAQMGELELVLGEIDLGVGYLEAAAREFADRADLTSLEAVAGMVRRAAGEEAFETSPVRFLLDQLHARIRPIGRIDQAPIFTGLGAEELFELEGAAQKHGADPGVDLLREGDPAVRAFVIVSGILSIRLETPDGGSRIVRCCFPGDLIGESSVIGGPGATCNATVRSESPVALWMFDGERLRALCQEQPDIRVRIESARAIHRLDSFFSMNEATGALDVSVRDKLLGCISAIRLAEPGETLGRAGGLPEGVYLIAEGKVEYRVPGAAKARVYEPDSFVGLRDTLHQLALEGEFVVVEPCHLVCFDPEGMQEIAAAATPEVIAVLERLE